jgi:hypothetical protein
LTGRFPGAVRSSVKEALIPSGSLHLKKGKASSSCHSRQATREILETRKDSSLHQDLWKRIERQRNPVLKIELPRIFIL